MGTLVHPKYGAYRTESRVEITRLLNAGYHEEGQEVVTLDDTLFHPGQHTVPEVLAHLEEHPEDGERVLAEEKGGQKRKGILGE